MVLQDIGCLLESVFDRLSECLIGEMRDTVMRGADDACISPVAGKISSPVYVFVRSAQAVLQCFGQFWMKSQLGSRRHQFYQRWRFEVHERIVDMDNAALTVADQDRTGVNGLVLGHEFQSRRDRKVEKIGKLSLRGDVFYWRRVPIQLWLLLMMTARAD